jgi:hypothetical protein
VQGKRTRKYSIFGRNRNKVKTTSAVDILRTTLETEGIQGWYKGMQAQILKAMLSQGESNGFYGGKCCRAYTYTDFSTCRCLGILFMAKGQFEKYALILIILAKRMIMRRSA